MRTQTTMRVLRERAGLSQTDLARLLGRKQPEVSMWEWGKEKLPDHIRNQIWGILKARLEDIDWLVHYCRPEDLDRAWDDVLLDKPPRNPDTERPAEPG